MYRLVVNPEGTGDDDNDNDGCHAAARLSTDEANVDNEDSDDSVSSCQLGHAATAK